MSSQSWFGNGAMSAPQDGSPPRETARSEDFRLRLPSGRALARRFNFSQASLCNAFPSILEVFSRPGNSHGPGAGTHTSAGPPSLGRVSGNLHEAVTLAAVTLAGLRSRRRALPP